MKIFREIYTGTNKANNRLIFDGHSWPFLLESDWILVDDIENADIVPMLFDIFMDTSILKTLKPNQTALILSIFHIDDHHSQHFYMNILNQFKEIFPNIILVHKNKNIPDDQGLVYYDIMFNRQKLFCTEYDKVSKWKNDIDPIHFDFVWSVGSNKDTYALSPIIKEFTSESKIFLHTGLIYDMHDYPVSKIPRMMYRTLLKNYLKKIYHNKGFINDPDTFFFPNNPNDSTLQHFKSGAKSGGFWMPVSDEYYKKSLVSIYVETLTTGQAKSRCVTEKTFDPLIKGNFILPFAYPGMIEDLKSYGFLFPDFIDLSYDLITDNDKRFLKFIESINKLCKRDNLEEDYNRNKHVLEHNRSVFYTTPYYKLLDNIKGQMTT